MKIGIVGLGLIGGSLGLDFVQRGHQVVGIGRRPETWAQAVSCGAVQEAGGDYRLLAGSEVVFVCTPIAAIAPTVAEMAPYLDAQTVITDVGSVKAAVVEPATRLWPRFVGGHPMAGKSEAGLGVAEPGLYAGKPYVLTPLPATPQDAIAQVAALVSDLQADLYQCTPEMHDQAVAWISHLPVMVSSSLIRACLSEPDQTVAALAQSLASSGFKDTSRVGGGSPELGLMMARYNQQALLRSLYAYREQLDRLTADIEAGNWDSLQQHLNCTQQARPKFVS